MRVLAASVLVGLMPTFGSASDLTFNFNIPSFGGPGINSTYYTTMMEIQNQKKPEEEELTTLQQFSQDLERRILATLSTTIVQQIFGENATPSGSFSAGGLTVTYQTVGNEIHITISDGITTTTIIVPAV